MPVTITIKVESGDAELAVGTAPSAPPDAATQGEGAVPAPTLLNLPGDMVTSGDADGEGPPPLDLADLGIGSTSASPDNAGTPPDDLVEGDASSDEDSAGPMPIEDLEKTTKSTRAKKS
ncbi:MAG: hypothetical protein WAL25_07050 [Acidimicrobiia bacterium]